MTTWCIVKSQTAANQVLSHGPNVSGRWNDVVVHDAKTGKTYRANVVCVQGYVDSGGLRRAYPDATILDKIDAENLVYFREKAQDLSQDKVRSQMETKGFSTEKRQRVEQAHKAYLAEEDARRPRGSSHVLLPQGPSGRS